MTSLQNEIDQLLARSGAQLQSPGRGRPRWHRLRRGIVGMRVVAFAMIASLVLYVDGSASHAISARGEPTADGTTVTMDVENVQNNYSELVCNLIVKPGPNLVDPATDSLTQDLTVAVTSVTTPVKRTYAKGMLPGYFPVPLTLARDVERANNAIPSSPYVLKLQRSASTMVFAIVILGIFVAIAAVGLFVAVETLRDSRRFQSPLTTWYAAMLFAVVPLRNALPGSPVFGSWIDLTIVLWVLVALVLSMLIYVAAWWRSTSKTGGP